MKEKTPKTFIQKLAWEITLAVYGGGQNITKEWLQKCYKSWLRKLNKLQTGSN